MIETILNTCHIEIGTVNDDFFNEYFTARVTRNRLPMEGLREKYFKPLWKHKFIDEFAPGCYKFRLTFTEQEKIDMLNELREKEIDCPLPRPKPKYRIKGIPDKKNIPPPLVLRRITDK